MGEQCNEAADACCGSGACEDEKPCGCEGACMCEEQSMADELTCLAKEAKMNVLLEKMEAHVEKEIGPKLDKVAKVAVDHLISMWKLKTSSEQMQEAEVKAYQEKLMALMKE